MSLTLILTTLVEHNEILSRGVGASLRHRNGFSIYTHTSLLTTFFLNCPSYAHGTRLPARRALFLNMSAGFSGHLPERMLGAWRPGSEGDWCLCHPSRELPLSWCVIEPLNQLPRSLSPPLYPSAFLSRVGEWRARERQEKSRLHPSSSLIYTWGVMGLCCVGACVGTGVRL